MMERPQSFLRRPTGAVPPDSICVLGLKENRKVDAPFCHRVKNQISVLWYRLQRGGLLAGHSVRHVILSRTDGVI
jgi:hypothetical protein